jgi:hypothetical protein
MARKRAVNLAGSVLSQFESSVVSGPGLNLAAAVKQELAQGNMTSAIGLLKRGSMSGQFAGKLEAKELAALRTATAKINRSEAMPVESYRKSAKVSAKNPLFLNEANFPERMSQQGFVPLSNIDINSPTLTLRQFEGDVRKNFIDEGAQNLIAAWNMDPAAAQKYSRFYFRTQDQLADTGIPLDRVGGAWATLSAQADPTRNAELLRQVLRDPKALTTTRENQLLALRFLSGDVDDAALALGRGKRFNFMQNSIDPFDPRYLTGDTRYAQNLQGVLTAYKTAPFKGLFSPRGRRYEEIYVKPGLEAASRMNVSPSELQAGSWGNWRNKMAGIQDDLPENLLSDLAGFDYNPQVYADALRLLSGG